MIPKEMAMRAVWLLAFPSLSRRRRPPHQAISEKFPSPE